MRAGIVRAASRCYIRRTCTGEIKDNAKKKIQRIACGAVCGREERQREAGGDERVDRIERGHTVKGRKSERRAEEEEEGEE